MAEGGEDIPMGTFPQGSNVGDDKDTDALLPPGEKGSGARPKGGYYKSPYDVPGYKGTSTSKKGETSFMDNTTSGRVYVSRMEQEKEEIEGRIKEKFVNPNFTKFFSYIDENDRVYLKLQRKNAAKYYLDGDVSKFSKGLRAALGKTHLEVNQEAYEKQKDEEEKQAKKEKELHQVRRNLIDNDEKLVDAIGRKDNLLQVVKEQEEAREHALSPGDKESLTSSIAKSKKAYFEVSKEVDELRLERDRLEQTERSADEIVQEGERQVETARERVNQRLLSLRDRIKEIFKKHGFTVVAVVSAIGVVIGVIVSSLKAGLGKLADGVGNGLKELGSKLAGSLPGMIGSIASLIFKTAGEVIKFLGKNAWLLIVGLVVFVVEMIKKKLKVSKRKKDQDHEPGRNTVHVSIH